MRGFFFYIVFRHSNIPKNIKTGSLLPVNRQLMAKNNLLRIKLSIYTPEVYLKSQFAFWGDVSGQMVYNT